MRSPSVAVSNGQESNAREEEGVGSQGIGFAALVWFSQALTAVLQRSANVSGSEKEWSAWDTTYYLVRQPMWLLGMACTGGTLVFTALATVQPILVSELIFCLAVRALRPVDHNTART
jgi:hypothetical protein